MRTVYGLADLGPMHYKVVVLDYNPDPDPHWTNNCDTFTVIAVTVQLGSWFPWRYEVKKYVLLYSSSRKHEGENFGHDHAAAKARQDELVEELRAEASKAK